MLSFALFLSERGFWCALCLVATTLLGGLVDMLQYMHPRFVNLALAPTTARNKLPHAVPGCNALCPLPTTTRRRPTRPRVRTHEPDTERELRLDACIGDYADPAIHDDETPSSYGWTLFDRIHGRTRPALRPRWNVWDADANADADNNRDTIPDCAGVTFTNTWTPGSHCRRTRHLCVWLICTHAGACTCTIVPRP